MTEAVTAIVLTCWLSFVAIGGGANDKVFEKVFADPVRLSRTRVPTTLSADPSPQPTHTRVRSACYRLLANEGSVVRSISRHCGDGGCG